LVPYVDVLVEDRVGKVGVFAFRAGAAITGTGMVNDPFD